MASSKSKAQRHDLSLQKKVEVINFYEKNPGTSVRPLGEKFDCGTSQIAYLLKRKVSILWALSFIINTSGSRLLTVTSHSSEFSEVNEALYKWFCVASSKNIHPGGPELIEKAKEIS